MACRALILVAILVLVGLFPKSAASETLTLRGDYWCPYVCAPGSDHEGYMVDLAREIFAEQGIKIDFALTPWLRTLEGVKHGTYDGAVGSVVGEVPELLYGPVSMGSDPTVFAVRRGSNFAFTGVEALRPLQLGVVLGYSYDDGPIDAYIAENKHRPERVLALSGDDVGSTLVRHLKDSRLDVILENEFVLRYNAERQGFTDQFRYVRVGNDTEVSIAFSPATATGARFSAILSDGIVRFHRSGRLKQIMSGYGISVPIPSLAKALATQKKPLPSQ